MVEYGRCYFYATRKSDGINDHVDQGDDYGASSDVHALTAAPIFRMVIVKRAHIFAFPKRADRSEPLSLTNKASRKTQRKERIRKNELEGIVHEKTYPDGQARSE